MVSPRDGEKIMKKAALRVAGILFLLVAILHLVRWIQEIEVIIGGIALPLWMSLPAFFLMIALSGWMFVASK
jgi:hypothetical protein